MRQLFTSGFDPRKMLEMGGTFAEMFARPIRPREETEADQDGARWAFELGHDPTETARVFLRLHEPDNNKLGTTQPL